VAKIAQASNDTSGFIASRGPVLVLAFRGTSSFKNFITDGNFRRVAADRGQGTVHDGFKSALDSVWDQIQSALGPPQAQAREIWVTGHSLGAALAQLAALRLHEAGYRVRNVYTFGTPRIGDRDFVDHYDRLLAAKSFPHINVNDVVTRVPLQLLGYRAAAYGSAQQFTGASHQMKPLSAEPVVSLEDSRVASREAQDAIASTTDFLPGGLRPAKLASAPPAASPSANLYGTAFKEGSLDEHGSFEYLFKLACAVIDYDLWPLEKAASARRSR
jgi:pimeloyl-ACP methyl ester carboxylesterase